jgi:outer membrane protein assembly factor BamA
MIKIFISSLLLLLIAAYINAQELIVSKIIITGNNKTKTKIIFRELEFKLGDTLSQEIYLLKKKKSSENLMNISLFNFVTISDTIVNGNNLNINVDVVERWYIWPIPVFDIADRNFNTWWKTKDFDRVNYGIDVMIYNFRGRNETVDFLFSLGYDEKYGIGYKIPYINKKQTLGLFFKTEYSQNHEVAVKTVNDKVQFYKDNNSYPKSKVSLSSGILFRPDIHNSHTFELSYDRFKFHDTLLAINPDYTTSNLIDNNFLSFYYQYKSDYRDYKPYPLRGYYFDFEITKEGLGLLKNEKADYYIFKATYRKFWKLDSRYYAAIGATSFISDELPYFIQNGLGYGRDYLRGYEYYVINGQKYFLLKTNLKYAIVPQRIMKVDVVKSVKFNTIPYAFFVNLYSDIGYVENSKKMFNNILINRFLYSGGLGVDFVTYYDKVMRLDFSVNHKGEIGWFIHFMTSI